MLKISWVFFLSWCLLIFPSSGQITLVDHGQVKGRIILRNNSTEEQQAAQLLQEFVLKISGGKLPVINTKDVLKAGDILLDNQVYHPQLQEDGFRIVTEHNQLHIQSASARGVVYGAVTLLEQFLGVDYFGEMEYVYPRQQTIQLPPINLIDNPAFRYRQTQHYALATDPKYKLWHRLEEPLEVFAANYWVHTFDRLLPSAHYGPVHPEYYSFFKGQRHPGKASQWCLTNEKVFEIVAQRVDSIFKANPGKNIISVSQNDGNFTNCTCDACRAVDEREGAPSGSLIYFLNKLAARFPDKEFSTLAYLYSMHPPKHLKPLPNVNIMLCDIDCDREVSLTENASGQDFMKALRGWSAITKNIFIWDYGINFDNYVSPFPNLHILQDNMRLFKQHHATMHFSQIASSRGGDFAELRSYLVAKLLWNPDINIDSVMQHFLHGYYGPAAPFIYQYIKTMEGALLGSGDRLWIYDTPVSLKKGTLRPALLRRYQALFDAAEKTVKDNLTYLERVQRSRLPLQYAELEIARSEPEKDFVALNQKLNLFEERVKRFKIPTLNERNNSPVDYCTLYRTRYMPREEKSLALGAKIIYDQLPGQKYQVLGQTALTDGLFGGSTFGESWVGWEGQDATFTVDLGTLKPVQRVEADFLHQLGAWILLPQKVTYSYSSDGINFTQWNTVTIPEDRSPQVKFVGISSELIQPTALRYIKVEISGTKICPEWHYGVGHACWFFVDEISVN